MANIFLGRFLVHRGFVTEQALQEALKHQQEQNQPLGCLAVERGWLTPAQVAEIYQRQKHRNKRFGMLAREMGYLAPAQVEELLAEQSARHVFLGEALQHTGALGAEEFSRAFNEYSRLQRGLKAYTDDLLHGTAHADYLILVVDAIQAGFQRFLGVEAKLDDVAQAGLPPRQGLCMVTDMTLENGLMLGYTLTADHDTAEGLTLGRPEFLPNEEGREPKPGGSGWGELANTIHRYVRSGLNRQGVSIVGSGTTILAQDSERPDPRLYLPLLLQVPQGEVHLGFQVRG